jgi:purine-binding chemotaxis protein CheW
MEQMVGSDVISQMALLSDSMQFLTFTVGNEEYGVDITTVREIKGFADVTRLPSSPPFMRGVTNLRGSIIPIFDMRARFALLPEDSEAKNVIITFL